MHFNLLNCLHFLKIHLAYFSGLSLGRKSIYNIRYLVLRDSDTHNTMFQPTDISNNKLG